MTSMEEIRAAFVTILKVALGQSDASFMSIPARVGKDPDLVVGAALDELEQLRTENERMGQALAEERESYHRALGDLHEAQAEVERLKADNNDLESERGEMNLALREELAEHERLKRERDALARQLAEAVEERERMRWDMSAHEAGAAWMREKAAAHLNREASNARSGMSPCADVLDGQAAAIRALPTREGT